MLAVHASDQVPFDSSTDIVTVTDNLQIKSRAKKFDIDAFVGQEVTFSKPEIEEKQIFEREILFWGFKIFNFGEEYLFELTLHFMYSVRNIV